MTLPELVNFCYVNSTSRNDENINVVCKVLRQNEAFGRVNGRIERIYSHPGNDMSGLEDPGRGRSGGKPSSLIPVFGRNWEETSLESTRRIIIQLVGNAKKKKHGVNDTKR